MANIKGLAGQAGQILRQGNEDANLAPLNKNDPAATAHIGNVVQHVVDGDPSILGKDRHAARLAVFEELVKSADFGKLADTAQVGVVRTNLASAVASAERERQDLAVTFTPDKFGAKAVDGAAVTAALAAHGGLAKTLGAELNNDGWARAALSWGVRTDRNDGVVMSRKDLGTEYAAAGRSYLGMFQDLQSEASASPDVEGKADFRDMLDRARGGVGAGQQGLAYALTTKNGAFEPKPENLAMAADALPDPFAGVEGTMLLDDQTRGSIHLLGQQLGEALLAYENDPKSFDWADHAEAKTFAQAEHGYWLKADRARAGGTTQGRGVTGFDDLSGEQQVQNLRSTVAALQGLVRSDNLIQSVLSNEPPDAAVVGLLQEHLDMASQQALGTERYDVANTKFAEAVADQMTPQIGWILQKFGGGELDNGLLNNLNGVLNKMAHASGLDLPTKGAGAASVVAVEHMGELLAAVNPDQNKPAEAWQAEAESILEGSGFGSAAAFLGALVDTSQLPVDIKEQVGAKWADNWGIEDIMKIPEGGDTQRNVKNFAVLMAALNATWLTQQAGRARQDEAGGGTDSRVQNEERDVFAPYLGLLQADTPEGVLGQLFRILQDQMEGMKKAGVLPQPE